MMRQAKGFTLVEVLIAAGLLGVFAVVAAQPLERAALATSLAADRGTAVYYAEAGLEWARGCLLTDFTAASGGYGATSNFDDTTRGFTFVRVAARSGLTTPKLGTTTVIWKLTSTVAPVQTGPYRELPKRLVRRLGDSRPMPVASDVKIVSFQSYWLTPTQSVNSNV